MRWILIMMLFCLVPMQFAAADDHAVVKVWPETAPGEKGDIPAEHEQDRNPKDGVPVIRLADVSEPTLTMYPAPADKATGTMVIVCPGGGYQILAWNLEGTEIAEWLNSIGVSAAILKYRVPRRKDRPMYEAPLQDVQRAIRLMRRDADKYGVDPNRIGILGFSAGGHLTAAASTRFDKNSYDAIDEADKLSCRPDFSVLVYPAYLTVGGDVNKLAPEITVTKDTPPAILIQTEDDGIKVECAIAYYLALKHEKVPVEMHLYPSGGHGYGLRESKHDVHTWPARVGDWMKARGLLEPAKK